MTQVNPLTQLQQGHAPSADTINENFNILMLACNDVIARINAIKDKLTVPPEFNVIIENINLFGVVDGITYDENKLSATRLNANFEKFKLVLLTIGEVKTLNGDIPFILEDAYGIPAKPTNLQITGIAKSEIGDDVLIGLSWTDNANNEDDFELYQSSVTHIGLNTTIYFKPENGGILIDTPLADATTDVVTISDPFYDIAIGEYLPDNATYFSINNDEYNFAIRAANTVGVSAQSDAVYINNALADWEYAINRPYDLSVELYDLDPVNGSCTASIDFHQGHPTQSRQGYELYRRWSGNSLGFPVYPISPYTWEKIAEYSGNIEQSPANLIFNDISIPSAVYDGGMLNQYYEFKLVAFNYLSRSMTLNDDMTDVVRAIMPPLLPANFTGQFSGNNIVLSWDKTNGSVTEVELWHSVNGTDYTKLSTSGESGWTYDNNIPVGYTHSNISQQHHYYKIKAINDNGDTGFTSVYDYDNEVVSTPYYLFHFNNSKACAVTLASWSGYGNFSSTNKFGGASLQHTTEGKWDSISAIPVQGIKTGGGFDLWVMNKNTLASGGEIISQKEVSNDTFCSFELFIASTSIAFRWRNGGYSVLSASGLQNTRNRWIHIEVSCYGDITRLFINGQLSATANFGEGLNNGFVNINTVKPLILGNNYPEGGQIFLIDELRFFPPSESHVNSFTPPSSQY